VVRFNDRVLVLGSTGSGKSELLNYLASGLRCQRLLLDTKHEFALPGVEPVSDPGEIDWSQPLVHYRDATGEVAEFGELFGACFRRSNLVVIVHELGDVCEFQPNKTPREVNQYLSKGRTRGLGFYAGSQRPFTIPVRARGESDHVFMVGERFMLRQDHDAVAEAMGQDRDELARLVDRVQAQLGGEPDPQGRTHAYVWFQRHARQVLAAPPLPDEHRKAITIGRTLGVDANVRTEAA
jgi:energy-coupling factor transporter ATP-binding protein EcfA2